MSEIIPLLKHKTYSILYSCKRFHCLCVYILFDHPATDGCWDHFLCVVLLQCPTELLCMCVCPQVHVDPHDGLFTLVDTDRHYKLYHWFIQQMFMSICLLCRCGWILSFRVKKMDTKFHIQNEPKCVQKHIHTEAHAQVRDMVPTLQALSVCIRTDRCAHVGGRSIQHSLWHIVGAEEIHVEWIKGVQKGVLGSLAFRVQQSYHPGVAKGSGPSRTKAQRWECT